jgi:hypothetical protein
MDKLFVRTYTIIICVKFDVASHSQHMGKNLQVMRCNAIYKHNLMLEYDQVRCMKHHTARPTRG